MKKNVEKFKENIEILRNLTIVLETIFYGGSIALFSDGQFVGGVRQTSEISRSEFLLSSLDNLLVDYLIKKNQINNLILTLGSSGKTSERISSSIAKGLSDALSLDTRYVLQQNVLMRMFDRDGRFLIVDFIDNETIYWLDCNVSGDAVRKKGNQDLFRETSAFENRVYLSEEFLQLFSSNFAYIKAETFNFEDVYKTIIMES